VVLVDGFLAWEYRFPAGLRLAGGAPPAKAQGNARSFPLSAASATLFNGRLVEADVIAVVAGFL
jgi:hypothetical protein